MKNNFLVLLSLLVIVSMTLAACAPASNEPAAIIVHGSTPEVILRPAEGSDGVIKISLVYSEGVEGTKSQTSEAWINTRWYINELVGDTPAVAPSEFTVKIKNIITNNEYSVTVAPGGNAQIQNSKPQEYEVISLSVVGWICTQREGELIWDCRFKK